MRKLLWILVLIVAAYVAWRWWRGHHGDGTADRGQQLLFDRVWVDHLPSSQTDTIQIFAAVTEEPMGLFDSRSVWRGQWELFRYEPRGDGQLELLFPQSRDKQRLSYRAWQCNEKRDFDFCLEISGGKGTRKYYSQRGWEIGALDGAQAAERRLLGAASAR
jgi:hypothetical protein